MFGAKPDVGRNARQAAENTRLETGGGKQGTGLGWKIAKQGDYRIDLPPLSPDEEALVLAVEDSFRDLAGERKINEEDVGRELGDAIARQAERGGIMLDREQREYLARYAKMHVYGFAFMDALLADDSIEEISVIGLGKPAYVYVRKQGWRKVNASFEDEKALMDCINKMAKGIGRRITLQSPRLDAMLPDGSRLHASLPPISHGEITVRKFRQRPFSPKEIVDMGTADCRIMAFLSMLMQTDTSLIVAGNTASGKTTTLNALFSFVPENERVLITEETPEISIPHGQQVRLVANREMGLGLRDLVYDSLRMRPDRMIVGEVRSREEVEALFDVLLGGQARGTYATFHAQSAEEAVLRLRKFGIDEMDLRSMDCVVVQRRMLVYERGRKAGEARKITEIAEIGAGGRSGRIFSLSKGKWDYRKNELAARIAESFDFSPREFEGEMKEREKWMRGARSGFEEFFSSAQKKFHS